MQLAKVVGSLVSTRKSDKLLGMKILVAVPVDMETFEEKGAPFVTVDAIGAGEGEVVMCVGGSSSRQTDMTDGKPVDNTIVAIIDSVDVLGKRLFDKAVEMQGESAPREPDTQAEEKKRPGDGEDVSAESDTGHARVEEAGEEEKLLSELKEILEEPPEDSFKEEPLSQQAEEPEEFRRKDFKPVEGSRRDRNKKKK